ncbi:MAG: hypothetical protein NTW29_12970 [Bacteroidetes bacterium]|nr:hypothetical protein [Bacteroidota bacterium]
MNSTNHSDSINVITAAFTVVSPNYLSFAWSVRKSFLQHNPDKSFYIGVIGSSNTYPAENKANVLFSADLPDSCIAGMTERYNPFELSCALKPFFAHQLFLQHPHIERLIYLDGDMHVFGAFPKLSESAITISVHRTTHIGYLPGEVNYSIISLNRYGVYNAGYFELQRKEEAFAFLEWWKNLLTTMAYSKPDEHLFTDQLWLNLVHSYFDDIYVNKKPGYNVGFWNLIERNITVKDGEYFVNGEPLVLFHYSKYKPETPEKMVEFEHPFLTFTHFPQLKPIFDIYRKSVMDEDYEKIKALPYPYTYKKEAGKRSFWKRLFSRK